MSHESNSRVPYHLLIERVADLTTQLRAIGPLAETIVRADERLTAARDELLVMERALRAAERERDAALEDREEAQRELADVRDAALGGDFVREKLKRAYRTGYLRGRSSANRGTAADLEPELSARGELGELMRGAK